MKYAELDERTKQRVKDRWQSAELGHDWWDSTYEDTVVTARKLGIEISTTHHSNGKDRAWTSIDISFSGFWSQGDGCCFSGTLHVAEMFEATKDMAAHAPNDEELMRLAGLAESIHAQITAYRVAHRLGDEEDDDWPECCPTMTMRINGKERSYTTEVDDNYAPAEINKECDSLVADFAQWIYNALEAEHDYLTSDDAFAGWIDDDDPDFDEDGNY